MPETFGSFTDLLNKLKEKEGWDGEICIKGRVDNGHHDYTNHYYLRKFNFDRSYDTGKLELDIPEDQEIGEPRSIEFEDLTNGKYEITAENFSDNNVQCMHIMPGFWWKYEWTPRLNAKGGKRRKKRTRRGGKSRKKRRKKNTKKKGGRKRGKSRRKKGGKSRRKRR